MDWTCNFGTVWTTQQKLDMRLCKKQDFYSTLRSSNMACWKISIYRWFSQLFSPLFPGNFEKKNKKNSISRVFPGYFQGISSYKPWVLRRIPAPARSAPAPTHLWRRPKNAPCSMDMSAYMGNVVGKYWGSNVGKCWYMEHIGCIWMYHLGFIWLYDFWFPPIKRVKKVQINLAILSVKWLGGKSPSWGFSGSC